VGRTNIRKVWNGQTVLVRRDVIFEETVPAATNATYRPRRAKETYLRCRGRNLLDERIRAGSSECWRGLPEPTGQTQIQIQNDGTESGDTEPAGA